MEKVEVNSSSQKCKMLSEKRSQALYSKHGALILGSSTDRETQLMIGLSISLCQEFQCLWWREEFSRDFSGFLLGINCVYPFSGGWHRECQRDYGTWLQSMPWRLQLEDREIKSCRGLKSGIWIRRQISGCRPRYSDRLSPWFHSYRQERMQLWNDTLMSSPLIDESSINLTWWSRDRTLWSMKSGWLDDVIWLPTDESKKHLIVMISRPESQRCVRLSG